MRKQIVVLALALFCASLFATGCRARPVTLDPSSLLGRDLLYLGKDGDDRIVVDPANAERYIATGEVGGILDPLPAFAEISLDSDAGKVFLATGVALSARVPVIQADSPAAAAASYPKALLEGMLWNGGEYALRDYDIKSTKLLSDKNGKLTVEFAADIAPVSDPFSPAAGFGWGAPGSDGFVRGLRLVIHLYENSGRYCLYEPEKRMFAEATPRVDYAAPKTRYEPAKYDDPSLAWEEGKEVERVICEDEAYSYVYGVRLRRGQPDYFESTIYRIDASTGERLAMFDLQRNTLAVRAFAQNEQTLFVTTVAGGPYSEGRPGQVAALDLDTGEYTVLIADPAALLGGDGERRYFVRLTDGARPRGIYELDIAQRLVRRVSALPGRTFDPAYEGASLHHISDGRLYVLWPEPVDAVPGPTFATYAVDPVTGAIERQPD